MKTLVTAVSICALIAAPAARQAAVAPADAEAAARAALARPINAGSIPFLLPHSRYSNVAGRLAASLRDARADVRAVAARTIFVSAGRVYGDAVAAALPVERDPIAGAEMVRALMAIRGASADADAIKAAQRLGVPAINAVIVTMTQARPLDVLTYLVDLDADSAALADALLRAIAADAGRVARAIDALPAGTDLAALSSLFSRAGEVGAVVPAPVIDSLARRGVTPRAAPGTALRAPDRRWSEKEIWRSVDPLPGLDAAVATAAGCQPAEGEIGVMQVTYGVRGQVRAVQFESPAASAACREAAAMLAVLELAPVADVAPSDRTDHVVAVFTRDALECEGRSARARRTRSAVSDPSIIAPRKLRDIPPVYPKALIAARVQGTVIVEAVIERSGCVARSAVVEAAHPSLNTAALAAVAQWRFAPTLLNGEPVAVIMRSTSTFSLK